MRIHGETSSIENMIFSDCLNMGGEWGHLAKIRRVVYFRLSPHEQKAFAGVISHGIPNMIRRIREQFLIVVPRKLLSYASLNIIDRSIESLLIILELLFFSFHWWILDLRMDQRRKYPSFPQKPQGLWKWRLSQGMLRKKNIVNCTASTKIGIKSLIVWNFIDSFLSKQDFEDSNSWSIN